MSDQDFYDYVLLIKNITGIKFGIDKKNLIEYRLSKRLFDKGLDPQKYLKLLNHSEDEMKFFINQITTHKTEWFRESEHFDFLTEKFAKRNGPIYIWSAACSTGEEPYSIMMTLGELGCSYEQQRILATDISSICVSHAQQGVYSLSSLQQALPSSLLSKYFVKPKAISGASPTTSSVTSLVSGSANLSVNPLWRDHSIKFKELNLNDIQLPSGIQFDVIFIRNVLIYFEIKESLKILKNLITYLKPGGNLILGLTEPLQQPQDLGLKRVSKSIYECEAHLFKIS